MSLRLAFALLALSLTHVLLRAQSFAESSVLASGKWRKVSVSSSGVYRLTTSDLQKMGFSDPASVRIYGAGGRQLSFIVGNDSRDDVTLIPAHHDANGVVFYAEGPDVHALQSNNSYLPELNVYSRKAFYFITSSSADDSFPDSDPASPPANSTPITTYDNVYVYAPQSTNISSTGREWVGAKLTYSKSSLTLSPNLTLSPGSEVDVNYRVCHNVDAALTLSFSLNGDVVATNSLSPTTQSYTLWSYTTKKDKYAPTSTTLSSATFSAPMTYDDNGVWISYLTLSAQSPLDASSGCLLFRSASQARSASDVVFSVANFPSDAVIWDVTNPSSPSRVATQVRGSSATFATPGGSLREFALFSPSASLPSPSDEGDVANQNLHTHQSVNYLVVTSSRFADVAAKFCALHERVQGMSTRVVLTTDIFNEFAAGRADASAIRNYIKMLYDRGLGTSSELQAVFLLGSGSYDNFDVDAEANVVPTYQTSNSSSEIYSYPIEDFYGWLEDGEGRSESQSTVDVGIGRLPVVSLTEAEAYFAKVQAYMESPTQGDWRAKAIFVGLQGDSNEHQTYANSQATFFEEENPDMETIRNFAEAYPAVKKSTGTSFPQSVTDAQNLASSGCSLFHYTGHSSVTTTGNNYLSYDFVSNLQNFSTPFVFVAASCNTAPFDHNHITLTSSGLFNPNGGFIATFAATREVYGNGNYNVTRQFVKHLYATDADGKRLTMGEAMKQTKRKATKGAGSLKFILQADPAAVISTPVDGYVVIDSVNAEPADEQSIPLKALAASVLKGSVRTNNGDVDESFNGLVRLTLYDKSVERKTSGVISGTAMSWTELGAKLFSGKVNVVNGRFVSTFILSKEFDLNVGYGHAKMYASADDGRDVMGSSDAILVGGMSDANLTDTIGPVINAYVDYNRDANGNAISSVPYLYLTISDPQGVNLSTQGVGHDISLVIDSDRAAAVSLNDYFSYSPDDFTTGTVAYPLSSVSLSSHSFTVKAWDNLNNSSSATFIINLDPSSSKIHVEKELLSISDDLRLTVQSDAFGQSLSVDSRLYSLSGTLVARQSRSLSQLNGEFQTTIPVAPRLPAPGVYVLHVEVKGNGRKAEISKKIIFGRQ